MCKLQLQSLIYIALSSRDWEIIPFCVNEFVLLNLTNPNDSVICLCTASLWKTPVTFMVTNGVTPRNASTAQSFSSQSLLHTREEACKGLERRRNTVCCGGIPEAELPFFHKRNGVLKTYRFVKNAVI